jgi:hypothetical protein
MNVCCDNCFDSFLSNCPTGITVNAGLTPAESYKWIITDKFQSRYQNTVVADGNGSIVIAAADLPAGFFNPFAGEFGLQIVDPVTNVPQPMRLCRYYDCVQAQITGGNDTEDQIGLPGISGGGGGGQEQLLVPFTGVSTLHFDWLVMPYIALGNSPIIQIYEDAGGGVYELRIVGVTQNRDGSNVLQSVDIDLGGTMTGYAILSA